MNDKNIIESDIVIVGSGIGGAMVAYSLASRGLNVSLLERGLHMDEALIESVFNSESFIGHPSIPLIPLDFAGDITRSRPVPEVEGGLARFYSGVSLRMREKEFEKWPFDYNEIEPFYSEAEQLMMVAGIPGNDKLEPNRSKPYPLKLPPVSEFSKKLMDKAQKMGLAPFQHPFVIDFDPKCIRCNHCNQVPCLYGVKWSPDSFLQKNAHLPMKIYNKTNAIRLNWNKNGKNRQVESVEAIRSDTKERVVFKAKKFIIAGGALFTPKVLMLSGASDWNPIIGKYLMTHCLSLVIGFFPFKVSAEKDFHKWWSIADFYFDKSGQVRGLIQQDHLTSQKKIFSKIPKILHSIVSKFYYNTCQLLVIAEDEPIIENRVELDPTKKPSGLIIHQSFTKNDLKRRKFLSRQARKIMRRAGAILALSVGGKSIYHACGTCRMGTDPSNSATDPNGKVWGFENVYVADASLFPTSSGVNPSLSIAANALRIATKIK